MAIKPVFECSLFVIVIFADEHFLQVLDDTCVDSVSETLPFEKVRCCLSVKHTSNTVASPGLSLGISKCQSMLNVAVKIVNGWNGLVV
jgi:hypothetical protein